MVPREMVLYRLADATLLIHTAIALNEPGMAKLESLGTPKILVVPNRIHRFDAGVYRAGCAVRSNYLRIGVMLGYLLITTFASFQMYRAKFPS
jgi:hypothetical protein